MPIVSILIANYVHSSIIVKFAIIIVLLLIFDIAILKYSLAKARLVVFCIYMNIK